jgi:hypothetical protein
MGLCDQVNIALDFDDTYTRDTKLWDAFIWLCNASKHDIRIVTMRKKEMEHPALNYLALNIPVVYTEGNTKRSYCNGIGWFPDVWIDDSPEFIVDLPIKLIGMPND